MKKISKDTVDLNILNQLDLSNIYRMLHSKVLILFKCTWNIYQVISDYKISYNTLKDIPVIQSIFSDHNEIELGINNRKIPGKFPNIWKLSNTLLYNL